MFGRTKPSQIDPNRPLKYGLLAGNGRFPFLVLDAARSQGVEMVVAAIKEETFPELAQHAKIIEWLHIGQLGKLIKFFQREGVTHALMAGQVKHNQIFSGAIPDFRMVKMLAGLLTKNTNSLIGAVTKELASEGITVIDSTSFLTPLLAPNGILTTRSVNEKEQADIDYGIEVAREVARLDLGQTIVVSDRAVVAVEAMEGTDATILRAATLVNGRPLTVVKVAKPNQDMRFDVPVVGLPTIETMIKAKATAISITAEKTLIFDREEMLLLANKNQIAILGTKL
ncbi:MAG: UDP-2,3-diacylglucosamine diphosphatase LpxI [Blastocatellia bacterium]|nr:UDP-2,3-diacylglucosamine diphosphatase LpxI [Blastocatellia bacterium]MBN8722709.1 UDP-2,3-diacylglucosamine diphosphatase LpxI [Acidobacteriota bacterium]